MISKLAYVSEHAKLGKDVTVEPFAYIAADVQIGDECWIGPGAIILDGARLGKQCKIHSSSVIAGIPQDLKFHGEHSTVVLGDHVTVRECATINRGTAAKGVTFVGNNTLIMAYAHVGHDCTVGHNCILVNNVSLAGEVTIEDWAILGGHTAVHQFCHIGAHAMLSGGSLVSKDVPPFVKAAHEPLSFVGVNFIGLRRRGFSPEKINEIHDMFRILFQSGYNYTRACEVVETQVVPSSERDQILHFIRSSKRGILKPYNPKKSNDTVE